MSPASSRRRSVAAVALVASISAVALPRCFLPAARHSQLSVLSDYRSSSLKHVLEIGSTATGGVGSLLGALAYAAAGTAAAVGGLTIGSRVVSRRSSDDDKDGEKQKWVGAEKLSALTASVGAGCMDNVEIAKILPHRYPFLLVDKVISVEKYKRAVGVKNVTANEPQFTGHFPERPIMPGVLMVEALAQLAGVVCMNPGDQVFFAGIDGVKFRKPVVPGDTLVMEVEVLKFREKSGIAKLSGRAYVDGKLAIEVKEFTCALVK
eukprot:TRINITY_DN23950_c0_g1_i1.p1 TRINITY_DN23950_c0_g1~~TRINITY_DN23950_c0_g1_i1.p1  ORF type:complete len:275 (+),score=51.09 TRINITY_DN23950_c0_g1_i1:35-826(+)